ncbi:MAG: serine/threonine protein kinase [Planctomycetota bacterium]|nr:MAG: serine/threonine protein kinase [Planctomycetota bacterium]
MAYSEDAQIGQRALKKGYITGAQFVQALEFKKTKYPGMSLGEIFLKEGFLSKKELQNLREEIRDSLETSSSSTTKNPSISMTPFGVIAQKKGWLDPHILKKALEIQEEQKQLGNTLQLGEILMIHFGFSVSQVLEVLKQQGKTILKCVGCGAQYNVSLPKDDEIFFCLTCNDMLASLPNLPSVRVRRESPKPLSLKDYSFIEKLGTGEMGVVYKGRNLKTSEIVAIKLLSPRYRKDSVMVRRFQQEAETLISIHHPHIVKGLDFQLTPEICFYVMEYLEGKTVSQILEQGPMKEKAAFQIVADIGRALAHVHYLGFIHRDIKPSNIFVNTQGRAKLFDLGLMKNSLASMNLTSPGTVLGTPMYMSPEQALGKKEIDIRSDIYSLGMTLVHMVTGEKPYGNRTISEIYSLFFRKEFLDAPALVSYFSPKGFQILAKMISPNPQLRYQNPSELVEEVEKFLEKDPS